MNNIATGDLYSVFLTLNLFKTTINKLRYIVTSQTVMSLDVIIHRNISFVV